MSLRFAFRLQQSPGRFFNVALTGLLALAAGSACDAGDRGADPPRTPEAAYGEGVRPTDKRSPAEEQAGFHLPTGFVAELVAAEPQIAKPLNMAFDRVGRLWITDTVEYPYPAPPDAPARDSIKVLADNDGNGSFETVTTFADGLNIPIGILPVDDGVICFSIPNIMHLKDVDGDGRCDERRVLLGPFDTSRDTHGMVNALRLGADGWIYACHGFNNQSHVQAADGSEIHLISGNTFRFRPDGSHVEQFTHGQVNPFGMTCDEWGNWFTADCHSKPVTMLVRGGYYESFGRPHDGLGFVPSVMDHLHGSTAICGIHYYMANQFPAEFRNKFYSGNVMTSRINCNRLQVGRDHITLVEEPDFMTSDDPWFRPVDIQLGPDGALYVADFYNKIIGHYEVRLDHPERDRNSGRIWRIAYRGLPNAQDAGARAVRINDPRVHQDFSPEYLAELASENITRRQFAIQRLVRTKLSPAQRTRLEQLVLAGEPTNALLRSSIIWVLHQQQLMNNDLLAGILGQNQSPHVLVTVLKAWEDSPPQPAVASTELRAAAVAALASDTPQVALAAAAALAQQGGAEDVAALLAQINERPAEGAVTRHAMRIAVKTLLRQPNLADQALVAWQLPSKFSIAPVSRPSAPEYSAADASALAGILPAVDTPRAAEALLSYVLSSAEGAVAYREAALKLACKHMSPAFSDAVVALLEQLAPSEEQARADLFASSFDQQTLLAIEAITSLQTSRQPVPLALEELIEEKIVRLASAVSEKLSNPDASKPLAWQETQGKLWQLQNRARQGDSSGVHPFFSSLTLGEAYVGTFSTAPFECPPSLRFWIVGHDGAPNMPEGNKNHVRLVHADTGAVLKTAQPPRDDAAREVAWDLSQWAGQPVRLECIDGDGGNAYAWMGIGGFSLPALNPTNIDGAVGKLASLIELSAARSAKANIESLFELPALSDAARARLAAGYARSRGLELGRLLIETAEKRRQSAAVTPAIALGDTEAYLQACRELAALLAAQMTLSEQSQLARGMIASTDGRRLLIELVDNGRMASQSLRNLKELLGTSPSDEDTMRLAELSEAASAAPSEAEQLIFKRIQTFQSQSADVAKGKAIFEKNCANCHKLRGSGQLVGPQLDGVGVRGFERLAEDVLLPNRNVDKAFRMSSLLLDDDRVMVGLVRDSANGEMQVVGSDGKVQDIDPDSVVSRRDTTRSLMPDNFSELLSDRDLADLMHFIMQR